MGCGIIVENLFDPLVFQKFEALCSAEQTANNACVSVSVSILSKNVIHGILIGLALPQIVETPHEGNLEVPNFLIYFWKVLGGFIRREPFCDRRFYPIRLFLSQVIGYLASRTCLEVF